MYPLHTGCVWPSYRRFFLVLAEVTGLLHDNDVAKVISSAGLGGGSQSDLSGLSLKVSRARLQGPF
jgi:hypothetical protein